MNEQIQIEINLNVGKFDFKYFTSHRTQLLFLKNLNMLRKTKSFFICHGLSYSSNPSRTQIDPVHHKISCVHHGMKVGS